MKTQLDFLSSDPSTINKETTVADLAAIASKGEAKLRRKADTMAKSYEVAKDRAVTNFSAVVDLGLLGQRSGIRLRALLCLLSLEYNRGV